MGYRICAFVCLFLAGCGLTKSVDKAGQVAEATMGKVDESVALQEQILEKNTQLAELTSRVADYNAQIHSSTLKTEQAIHQQILGTALDGLLDPKNTADLNPPTKMVPYGKSYAEEATEEELIATVDLLLNDAKYGPGGILALQKKMVVLTAAGILAGLTPNEKFKHIMANEVDGRGEYEEAAYEFAMLRYMFIRDGLFLPLIEKKTVINNSTLLKAASNFALLKEIVSLPYSDRVGISVSSIMYSQDLNPSEIATLASKAKAKFLSTMPQSTWSNPTLKAALDSFK